MVRNQKGFTIIELVVVIVILGVLAAVAFPRFQDLTTNARTAVVQGGIAAFKSAAVITMARASGVVPTAASVIAQTNAENVTFTGTCPTNVTATHTADPAVSVTFTISNEICNG